MSTKEIFDKLRQLDGKLTQEQVDKTNEIIKNSSEEAVTKMLGIKEGYSISSKGIDLICSFEGYRDKAYDDGVGVWTIGYGTIKYPNQVRVKKGDVCTVAQAKSYMANDLKEFEKSINESVTVKLTQNQYDALVSITYNIGSTAFKNSTLLKKLNSGDYKAAADQFLVWNKAKGKVLAGLTSRRKNERQLFLS